MRDVDWTVYQTLLAARGEKPRPRLAYLDGSVEIMTTSRRHEIIKTMIARLTTAYVEERGGILDGTGGETLEHENEEAGAEADETYFVGPMKPFPDLVIEVVLTHGGIDKLEIYRRMRVGEAWFWIDGEIKAYRLVHGRDREVQHSIAVPGIDLVEIAKLSTNTTTEQLQVVRAYRAAIKARIAASAPSPSKPRKRTIRRR